MVEEVPMLLAGVAGGLPWSGRRLLRAVGLAGHEGDAVGAGLPAPPAPGHRRPPPQVRVRGGLLLTLQHVRAPPHHSLMPAQSLNPHGTASRQLDTGSSRRHASLPQQKPLLRAQQ